MDSECTILTWGQALNAAETHGALVNYEMDGVEISAPMLPPGTDLYTWRSQQSFDVTRSQGALPLLEVKKEYQLISKIRMNPEQSIYFKINTYDRNQHLVKEFILDESNPTFRYPETAQSYEISLVMKANHDFTFHWVALMPVDVIKRMRLSVSNDLNATWVQDQHPNMIALYLGRRDSESWLIPIKPHQTTVVVRLSPTELNDLSLAKSVLQKLITSIQRENTLELPLMINGYGYPMPQLIKMVNELIISAKKDR
ncbi:accessory Sec system protein Asp3 [Fructilactobacillus carniphilus]|uniref:Accessory Sec system protein Asp3 n=1 Tax=Fructilactobacillus carniphilus TaxID=2940297 RepID=A0ABY5BWK6_9LACO|nr:accessory Sec system protein Asp3 [Fructilactobacillus carniphilus]USS90028.1 accessory Sec system protein Asp3 [Fructilactobacillus carniphilus]